MNLEETVRNVIEKDEELKKRLKELFEKDEELKKNVDEDEVEDEVEEEKNIFPDFLKIFLLWD